MRQEVCVCRCPSEVRAAYRHCLPRIRVFKSACFFQVQVFASLGQLEHQAARMEGASGNNQTFRQQRFVQIAMILRLECLNGK